MLTVRIIKWNTKGWKLKKIPLSFIFEIEPFSLETGDWGSDGPHRKESFNTAVYL